MRHIWVQIVVVLCCGFLAADAQAQRRIIELEIAASGAEAVSTQQRWMQMLSKVGADRIRSKTSGNGIVKISESELGEAIRVKIQGAINKGKLVLPGQSFRISQKAAIAQYIENLRLDKAEVALADAKAFGLTAQHLVDVNEAMKAKLDFSTKGKSVSDVIRKSKRIAGMHFVFDDTAQAALKRGELVLDELEGFSVGTSLAAIARTQGLVVVPKRERGKDVKLHFVDYRSADEFWPIGWPGNQLPRSALPGMYEKFPIEIRNAPLDQALKAVLARAKVPMLLDHNSLAIAEIDLSKSNVTFVKESSNYINLMTKVLNQTRPRMDFEIRLDENAKPFLWLSTSNPVR